MDNVQAILTVGVPTLAVLVGIPINGSRLSDPISASKTSRKPGAPNCTGWKKCSTPA